MPNEYFDGFTALISNWQAAYTYTVHSYVGLKIKDGVHLLFGKIELHTSLSVLNEPHFKLETSHVVAGQFIKPGRDESIRAILEKAKTGSMDRLNGILSLPRDHSSLSPYWHPVKTMVPSSLLLRGGRPTGTISSQEVDWELNNADQPYASLDELLSTLGLPSGSRASEVTTLEIVATSPASIQTNATIADGYATIAIRSVKALDAKKIKLGLQMFDTERCVQRFSVTGNDLQWEDKGDIRVAVHTVSVGDAPRLQAYLSYNDIAVAQRSIADPKKQLNPRRAIHQVFDNDLEILTRLLLKPTGKDLDNFANAVSLLFTLLGFSAVNYGVLPHLGDGPDIIATAPSGTVAVIECTTGHLDNKGKLTKLIGRTELVKRRLIEARHVEVDVQPVIVTSWFRDLVKGDLKKAADLRIVVLCNEDLQDALKQVASTDPDRTLERWKSRIPTNVPGLLGLLTQV